MNELGYLTTLWRYYVMRLDEARGEDGAVSTETAIITAILAGLALAIGAIIVVKVTAKAESIPTD
jgi:formate/nitrite transporter FocA (FNT family)